jgi:hypothetical protein
MPGGDPFELVRPVERRVAAADDHHVLPRVLRGSSTLSKMPRPYHGSAHGCGSRRGEKAPMPAAMTTAREGSDPTR